MHMRVSPAMGLALLLTVHCGDSDESAGSASAGGNAVGGATTSSGAAGGGGGAAPGASDYCETIVDFFCDFYLRCGRMAVSSVEQCRPRFLESCNSQFEGRYVDLANAGLLSLDADGLSACEAHLDTVACEQQIFELQGPCASIWRGSQPAGAPCGLDVEFFVCEPASECVLGLDLCGECRALVAIGGDCSGADTACGSAAFCDAGSCRARKQNGEACGPDDRCMAGSGCAGGLCSGPSFVTLGESCGNDRRCPYLSACIAGVCSATAGIGESCGSDLECENDFCGDAGNCEAPHANGQSCASSGQCQSGLCEASVCRALPSACIAGM